MKSMKIYARTNNKSWMNNYQGEGWQVVTLTHGFFPSGQRECVRFPSGYAPKVEDCEIVYVFDK